MKLGRLLGSNGRKSEQTREMLKKKKKFHTQLIEHLLAPSFILDVEITKASQNPVIL